MTRLHTRLLCYIILFSLLFVYSQPTQTPTAAQDDEPCTVLIEDALQLVGSACAEMGRNEACYGNNTVEATFHEDVSVEFDDSGDLVEVSDIISLVTQPADPDAGTWGIAFMSLQADLPDDGNDNLTFILLGDVNLSHDVAFSDNGTQAFTIESGSSEHCEDAPDGLLVRSPEGERARIVVNGVELEMSSALFLTAKADDVMSIQGLDGQIDVRADGQTESLTQGFQTTIPLDGLIADGTPTPPEPVPPGNEFPVLIQTSLFTAMSDVSQGGTGGGSLGQTYSDSLLTLNYPDGWAFEVGSSNVPTIDFSNDSDYLAAWHSSGAPPALSSGLLRGSIYQFSDFASLTLVEGGSSHEVLIAHSETEFAQDRITEAPISISIGDYGVTRYRLSLELPDRPTLLITHYALGDFIVVVFVNDNWSEFEPIIETMIASIVVE